MTLAFVAVSFVLWVIYLLRSIVLLTALSVFFAYLLAPVVECILRPWNFGAGKIRIPRGIAILMVYCTLAVGIGGAAYLFLPKVGEQLSEIAQATPRLISVERAHVDRLLGWYERLNLPPSVRDALETAGQRLIDTARTRGRDAVAELASAIRFIPWLVLIPVIGFFLLKDAAAFRKSALLALPQGRTRWRGEDFLQEVNSTLAFFIRAQLLASLFVGVASTLIFVAMDLPYGLVLGGVAGLFELVPFVGPTIVLLLAVVLASTQSLTMVGGVILALALLRGVQDYIVYPKLMARHLKLHPLAVILAVLSGATLGGLLGLFLAIPVTAILSISYRYLRLHLGNEGLVAKIMHDEDLSLPAVLESRRAMPAPVEHLTGIRVLVVDNDEDARVLLMTVLEQVGAEALGAANVEDALSLLGTANPDVLVSDLAMPGEDGFSLMRRIRARTLEQGGRIPSVALSGYSSPEDRSRALQAGFQTLLSKPVDPADLALLILELVSERARAAVEPSSAATEAV